VSAVDAAHDRVAPQLHAVESHLVPAPGHVQRLQRADGDARRPPGDQEERHAVLAAGARPGRNHDVVRNPGVGHEQLDAIQTPAVTGLLRGQRDAIGVPAAGGFGQRHGGPRLAGRDPGEHLLPLRLGPRF